VEEGMAMLLHLRYRRLHAYLLLERESGLA
jgi:hypothetical protein